MSLQFQRLQHRFQDKQKAKPLFAACRSLGLNEKALQYLCDSVFTLHDAEGVLESFLKIRTQDTKKAIDYLASLLPSGLRGNYRVEPEPAPGLLAMCLRFFARLGF